jgi:hypothetical protein
MRNRLLAIFCFAAIGFAIAGVFYSWWTFHDFTKPMSTADGAMAAANLVLCPPTLIFAACIDCEYGTADGLVTHLIVVELLNAALYAIIGAAFYRKSAKLKL